MDRLHIDALSPCPAVLVALINNWIPALRALARLLQFDYYLRWYQLDIFKVYSGDGTKGRAYLL